MRNESYATVWFRRKIQIVNIYKSKIFSLQIFKALDSTWSRCTIDWQFLCKTQEISSWLFASLSAIVTCIYSLNLWYELGTRPNKPRCSQCANQPALFYLFNVNAATSYSGWPHPSKQFVLLAIDCFLFLRNINRCTPARHQSKKLILSTSVDQK